MIVDHVDPLDFSSPKGCSGFSSIRAGFAVMSIPRDVREFIDNYPGEDEDTDASENLAFYSNTLRCRPDNKLVDEIHEQ